MQPETYSLPRFKRKKLVFQLNICSRKLISGNTKGLLIFPDGF